MVNTSLEYRKALYEDKRSFIPKVNILLSNGTVLELSGSQIMQGGVKIDDGVSSPGSFDIGSAVIGKLTLNINNMQDEYSDYNFTDAVVTVFVGLQLESRIEWLKKGVFSADDPTSTQSVITLECLDNMSKFDKQYDGKLSFPANLQTIVNYCCSKCGVLLNTNQFDNYTYRVEKSPFGENPQVTYREIISYCAQIAGCYARCNPDGRLELKWYDTAAFPALDDLDGGNLTDYSSGANIDGGSFTNYSSGDSGDGGEFTTKLPYHHIYSLSSLKIAVDDVVITGIRVTASGKEENGEAKEGETVLSGEAGYILELPSNPFVEYGKASTVADYLYDKIGGMRFRPADAGCLGDPSIEAGDCAVITDRKGNSYHCYVTNLSYTMGGFESLSCDAEPPARKTSQRYSEITKAIVKAREETEKQLSNYDQRVQQLNSLAMNAMGYYETTDTGDDGSTIKYMHDKPLMSESKVVYKKSIDGFFISHDGGKTFDNGFDKDGNAVLNVVAAIGIVCDWIKGGTLVLGGDNNTSGEMIINNADNIAIGSWGKEGIIASKGRIGGWVFDPSGGWHGDGLYSEQTMGDKKVKVFLRPPLMTAVDSDEVFYIEHTNPTANYPKVKLSIDYLGRIKNTLTDGEGNEKISILIGMGNLEVGGVNCDLLNVSGRSNLLDLYVNKIVSTWTLRNPGTTSAGTLGMDYNGNILLEKSSSRKYKKNISSHIENELNANKLYDLQVVQFQYKKGYLPPDDPCEGKHHIGFIAEEVFEKYPFAAILNKDGAPESWSQRSLIPPMLKLLQEQKHQIDELIMRVENLEKEVKNHGNTK
ncbi:tail fiber domain-containing protein [uncultured Robinsoniella sp.]|uniref:tail fiber domain-containing protein n=1 Tax=uncultured Robinsoniella sp. TaxID=904190 RepID=UPI00206D1971|nr:MAG TPA: Minor structural protein [Caudoviricetes sp.]